MKSGARSASFARRPTPRSADSAEARSRSDHSEGQRIDRRCCGSTFHTVHPGQEVTPPGRPASSGSWQTVAMGRTLRGATALLVGALLLGSAASTSAALEGRHRWTPAGGDHPLADPNARASPRCEPARRCCSTTRCPALRTFRSPTRRGPDRRHARRRIDRLVVVRDPAGTPRHRRAAAPTAVGCRSGGARQR